jgi:ATP-binding cassette subfamily C (CFTR/MRP) protein 4
MVEGLVRSPTSFFDTTPSGRLINTFSNDLGLLDMTLAFSFTDMIEGPIISLSMLINIFTIEVFFIPPGLANILFIVLFFIYSKRPIVECRQLYLKLRTPVFSLFGEMLSILTQIATFATRRQRLEKFARAADLSTKTNISFNVVSRGFGVYVSYVSSLILIIGFFIGVHFIAPADAGNYGVTIILLTSISDYLQYFLKQIITVESIMVSSERAMLITKLTPEADLRTHYDEEVGLSEEVAKEEVETLWPTIAGLMMTNFSLRYREELPLVLKDIDFTIRSGERIGIVGRTGAGKSSIIHAIFRLTEP